jgi:hypothetical protein
MVRETCHRETCLSRTPTDACRTDAPPVNASRRRSWGLLVRIAIFQQQPYEATLLQYVYSVAVYCPIELATLENTLLAFDPTSRRVPTTITRMTASITAYSAMSCASSCDHNWRNKLVIFALHRKLFDVLTRPTSVPAPPLQHNGSLACIAYGRNVT